jgi:C4-dicarboxylate-specific signal transduction histidine kinase
MFVSTVCLTEALRLEEEEARLQAARQHELKSLELAWKGTVALAVSPNANRPSMGFRPLFKNLKQPVRSGRKSAPKRQHVVRIQAFQPATPC